MYKLPEGLRSEFQNPMGPVYTTEQLLKELTRRDRVVAVGDIVAKTLIENGRDPWIIVVDYKTQRGADDPSLRTVLGAWGQKVLKVENPPATISDELFHAIQQSLKSKQTIRIEVTGEEDLAGLPYLALAKDGIVMCYGVPNKGVAMIRINKGVRDRAFELLRQMEVRSEPRRLKT